MTQPEQTTNDFIYRLNQVIEAKYQKEHERVGELLKKYGEIE